MLDDIKKQKLHALIEAIDKVGSAYRLEKMLGLSNGVISKWLHRNKHIPVEHVSKISSITRIPDYVLRPDIFEKK